LSEAGALLFWSAVWAGLALIPAIIAAHKGRSFFEWWLFGFLLWIIALPMAIMADKTRARKDEDARWEGLQQCPHCAEWIRPEASVCIHCSRETGAI